MARPIEEIDAEILAIEREAEARTAALKAERVRVAGQRWAKYVPGNIAELLVAAFWQAAGDCESEIDRGESEWVDLAPGVKFFVLFDTNIQADDTEGA